MTDVERLIRTDEDRALSRAEEKRNEKAGVVYFIYVSNGCVFVQ